MRSTHPRRAVTLVEMVIAIMLVSVTLVAALNTVGASKLGLFKTSDRHRGYLLAQDLMEEILQQDYADWAGGLNTFGIEAAPAATATLVLVGPNLPTTPPVVAGTRALFNDVDDYHNWSATPPQYKDGTAMSGLGTWTREVKVAWIDPNSPGQISLVNSGAKRITVTVQHGGLQVSQLTAIKTEGLPPAEACCMGDATCQDLRTDVCTAMGGKTQGSDTACVGLTCPIATILLVVTDPAALTAGESDRKTLMESWNYAVVPIAASATQTTIDAAATTSDAAYISMEIVAADLGTKLVGVTIGVVNEHVSQIPALQWTSGSVSATASSSITVLDNTHYITSVFNLGSLTIVGSVQSLVVFGSQITPGVQALSQIGNNNPTLLVAEMGAKMADGTAAAGRRVELPWGDSTFVFGALTGHGKTIMKRSIEWAAKICGDGVCAVGEECTCAADCGTPAAFEQPGATCNDGLDNDCDGTIDCADINCPSDPACVVTVTQ